MLHAALCNQYIADQACGVTHLALLDAICDRTVQATSVGLANSVSVCCWPNLSPGLHACIQSRDWSCQLQLHSCPRHKTHAGLAMQAAKDMVRLLQKVMYT